MTPNLSTEILRSLHYRRENGLPTPPDVVTRALKAAGDITAINAYYHDEITQALIKYLEGGNVTAARNLFKKSTSNAFNDAFDMGYVDGGAELPTDADANDWLNARKEAEFGFIETVFQSAKELKKEDGFEPFAWASARADGYTATLAAIYNSGRMWAKKNQLLKWNLGATEKHCPTCQKLAEGPTHRASWFLARNYIPRQPGAAMTCGGYNCDCMLTDKNGDEVTL